MQGCLAEPRDSASSSGLANTDRRTDFKDYFQVGKVAHTYNGMLT